MADQKQPENVEYFSYLGSMIINDARCTNEIKSSTAMAKAAFNEKKTLFTSKSDLNLRIKLVNYYTLSIALYGAGNWTLIYLFFYFIVRSYDPYKNWILNLSSR
jgi:hypothetical protein